MPGKFTHLPQRVVENDGLRTPLEKAEERLRKLVSKEADALFVSGAGSEQLFALKGADQAYRSLIENISEGALILTPEGWVVYANRCFAEMLRVPLEKVIGSEIHAWFAPVSQQALQTLLQTDTVDIHREEQALTAADGTPVPVYLSVSRLHQDGVPDYIGMIATDLTEQKRAEAILAADKLEHAILEQAADAIVICDEIGRIIRANQQAQTFYGKVLVGQLFAHAFPLRQSDGSKFLPVGTNDTKRLQTIEARLTHNGQEFAFLVSVGRLIGAQNQLLGSVVTLSDITERRLGEETLRASEAEFHTLAEAMPQIVWITRPDGWNIYFNQHWMDYTGLTLEESMGYGWNKPFHPEDQQRAWDTWETATKTQSIYSIESRLRRADGAYRWWLVRGVPLTDANGKILKWFGTCTDIHDMKLAELEIIRANAMLHESERRFSEMLDNVELVSIMLDRKGHITYCNEYLLQLTGWRRDEVIGQNWFDLFVPPELTYLKAVFFSPLLSEQPEATHHENEILTRMAERRTIRWNNSLLCSAAGDVIGIASIGEDITERKTAEARIKYLSRVHAMLSGINTLIVRVHDHDELFSEACRIATHAGGFTMAMICMLDRQTNKIVPTATAGKDKDLLYGIKDLLAANQDVSNTLVGRAIAEKQAIVSNDSANDSREQFGKKYSEAGVRSMSALPLTVSGEVLGALALYASEIEFFHIEELKLLTELADDIAFAIDHIDKQEKLNYLAYYDALTGLANRSLFLERVAQYLRSAANDGHKLALCLIDLERFKNINDSLGRQAGDALLRQVAAWLTQNTGDVNLLAHIDADHFAMVLPEIRQEGDLIRLIEKMAHDFYAHSFRLNNDDFRIAAKAGITLFPDDGNDADTLFKHAEAALKKAKASGDRYLFYTQKMTEAVAGKLTLENQLRQAIDNEEFVLHYQPKVNIVSGKITSAEALIRWNDPRTGLVPSNQFIPILEETGLIHEVGRWALRKAIEDNLRWRDAGLPSVRIAVNMSPLQLRHQSFIAEIEQVIHNTDPQAAAGLELEITESVIMENFNRNIASLEAIRAMGITIAIDDFGTGFSSLSYLSKLPVNTLKIDRSFISGMTAGPEGLALVSTIVSLAHAFKLKVVAEGVETKEQSHLLRLLGCDEIQGFLYSKPVPAEAFAELLRTGSVFTDEVH